MTARTEPFPVGPLLSKQSFDVLRRLPTNWYHEDLAVDAIADALQLTPMAVRASVNHLCRRHLAERRRRETIDRIWEIRKVGRPDADTGNRH